MCVMHSSARMWHGAFLWRCNVQFMFHWIVVMWTYICCWRKPEPSLQLDLMSGTLSADGRQTAGRVIQPFQTVAEAFFIWSVWPKCSVNHFLTALFKWFYLFIHFAYGRLH